MGARVPGVRVRQLAEEQDPGTRALGGNSAGTVGGMRAGGDGRLRGRILLRVHLALDGAAPGTP
eukprot:8261398-Pyramimonas_sp.AAC.1